MKMTEEDAKRAVEDFCRLGLYGADFMRSLTPEQVASACNGCGPASWKEEHRQKLDKWLKTFKLAFDGHDCDFTYRNDGTRKTFDEANDRLGKNCKVLADYKYAWYNPVRYLARHGGYVIADLCSAFGWEDYLKAYNEKGKTS